MRSSLVLLSSGAAALILAFGACSSDPERNELTQGSGGAAGGGGAAPDYVAAACDRICQASQDLGCGLTDCGNLLCEMREYDSYASWCESAVDAASRCIADIPDPQMGCANGIAFVDVTHFEQPCKDEFAALEGCLFEGPTGGIDEAAMQQACADRCAKFTGLPCFDQATCEGECQMSVANAAECNAAKASLLLCQLDNDAMASCNTDMMGTTEAVFEVPTACNNLAEKAFDCEFGDSGGF